MPDDHDAIQDTFSVLVEQLGFLFVDPADEEDLELGDHTLLHASVSVSGQVNGTVAIAMPPSLCRELAANMLGEDDPDDIGEEQAQDALRELTNVVCGHLVTTLAGENIITEISPPSVKTLPPEDAQQMAQAPESLIFESEGEPLLLHFTLEVEGQAPSLGGSA